MTAALPDALAEGVVVLDSAAATALLQRSVDLAREAQAPVSGPTWVAASVGPYGAVLADGSEYTGPYAAAGRLDVRGLRAFHRPRPEVLAAAGLDALACETLPALADVEALVAELPALGVPAWLSLRGLPRAPDPGYLVSRFVPVRGPIAVRTTEATPMTESWQVTVRRDPGDRRSVHLRVAGEVDVHVVCRLRADVDDLFDGGVQTFVVDLSDVPLLDSTGLSWLLHVRRRSLAAGGTFTLAGLSPQIARLLRITGLYRLLLATEEPPADLEADPAVL